jgi:hypothetical protein
MVPKAAATLIAMPQFFKRSAFATAFVKIIGAR